VSSLQAWWNDNRYEGEWKDDVKHGYGVKTWANGDRYEGEWRDGTKHGTVFTLYFILFILDSRCN
jgi:hypothetical protein